MLCPVTYACLALVRRPFVSCHCMSLHCSLCCCWCPVLVRSLRRTYPFRLFPAHVLLCHVNPLPCRRFPGHGMALPMAWRSHCPVQSDCVCITLQCRFHAHRMPLHAPCMSVPSGCPAMCIASHGSLPCYWPALPCKCMHTPARSGADLAWLLPVMAYAPFSWHCRYLQCAACPALVVCHGCPLSVPLSCPALPLHVPYMFCVTTCPGPCDLQVTPFVVSSCAIPVRPFVVSWHSPVGSLLPDLSLLLFLIPGVARCPCPVLDHALHVLSCRCLPWSCPRLSCHCHCYSHCHCQCHGHCHCHCLCH